MPNEPAPKINEPAPETKDPGAGTKDSSPVFDADAFSKQITSAVSAQLQEFRAEIDKSRTPKKEADEEEDWEEQFYRNPKETMSRFAKKLREDITADLVGRYEKTQSQQDFWSGFYSDHGHLKPHDDVVRAILSAKEASWAKENITVGEAYKRLAEIASVFGGEKKDGGEEQTIMDGLAFIQAPKRAGQEEKIATLSDAIRARQAKFRGK